MLGDGRSSCYLVRTERARMSWIRPLGSLFRARRTEGSVLILLWEGLPPAEAVLPRTPFATQHLSARVGRTWANLCLTGGTEGLDPAPQALPLAQQSSDTGSAIFPTSRAETSLNLPAGSWNSSGGGRQGTISAECSSSCRRPCAEVSLAVPPGPGDPDPAAHLPGSCTARRC